MGIYHKMGSLNITCHDEITPSLLYADVLNKNLSENKNVPGKLENFPGKSHQRGHARPKVDFGGVNYFTSAIGI